MGTSIVRSVAPAIALCVSAAVVQGQTEWTSLGPPGGGMGARLVVHPTGTLVLLHDGTVHQSHDGRTWTRVGIGLGSSWPVGPLIATPDGTLYAGTGDGVFRSDDVGRWWRKINNASLPPYAPVSALEAEPGGGLLAGLNYSVLRRLSTGGVWRSNDGGVNWQLASRGLPTDDAGRPIAIVQLHVTSEGVAFATTYLDELFRSVDGGATWTRALPQGETGIQAVASDGNTVYAGGFHGLFKSLDGGASWNPATSPIVGALLRRAGLVVDRTGSVFALIGSKVPQVWKSTDRAVSWDPASSGLSSGTVIEQLVVSGPSRVHALGWDGVFVSEDGGAAWSLVNDGLPPGRSVGALLVDAAGRVYIGGTAPSYTDDGRTWTSLLPQVADAGTAWALVATSTGTMVLFGDDAVFRTRDGTSWTRVHGSLDDLTCATATHTALVAATLTYPGPSTLWRSTDEGTTWTALAGPGLVNALVADSTGRLYAATTRGVHVSTDEGTSWTPVNTGLEVNPGVPAWVRALAIGSPGVLYAGTSNGLFKTDNGGSSWLPTALWGIWVGAVAVDGRGDIYAAADYGEGGVYVSRDGGATWRRSDLTEVWRLVADPTNPSRVYAGASTGVYVFDDEDGDMLPDAWERRYGLSAASGTGANGPDGDPDTDGVTNQQEFQASTHPRGYFTRFFAEGAITDRLDLEHYTVTTFFDTRFALLNPGDEPAAVIMRFLRSDGAVVPWSLEVAAHSRATVDARSVPGLAGVLLAGVGLRLENAEFATIVESDQPLVIDRTMTWDASGSGSHAEASVDGPATTWYFAEGATHSGFDLFYLVQNPQMQPADVTVSYVRPVPMAPLTKTYTVAPNSRFNIWVNHEATTDDALDGLASTDIAATFTSDVPVIVERAMYLNAGGQTFGAGHESAGVTAPSTTWFLAEGNSGSYFDLFVLLANPGEANAACEARFLLPDGTVIPRPTPVRAQSRQNIWVNAEGGRLADTAVSTTVTCDVPVVVERAMWWPASGWLEAHNSFGATVTGTMWALAEGEQGGSRSTETYILIVNTSDVDGRARVTLFFEDGTTLEKTVSLTSHSRTNVPVGAPTDAGGFGTAVVGTRFGAVIESLPETDGGTPPQIVVERAMYSNANGDVWAAGTNALATRLQ